MPRSHRRAVVLVAHLFALAVVSLGCGREVAQPKRPNVLFILTDEHRFDALGCYGNETLQTPHLDALAAAGARLECFYVAGPLCSPSRASFLSGLFPSQSQVMDNRERSEFPERVTTVADRLDAAGYRTVFVGKAHMGGDPSRWGFRELPCVLAKGGAPLEASKLLFNGEERRVTGPVTKIFVDEAIRFLEESEGDDRPWFLWLSTRAAHRPYVTTEGGPAYEAGKIPPPPGWPKGQPLSDHDWAGYYSTVSFLDREVGRLLEALESRGLSEDTLVVFAGDNGSMFGSHGEARKQVWYEECVRTPAIVRWPGVIAEGTVTTSPIVSVDFLPTVLEAAGASSEPLPEGVTGVSALAALRGEAPARQIAFAELERDERFGGGYWRMARDERFKYVRFDDGSERLYDLESDSSELVDLTSAEGSRDTLTRLRGVLEEWSRQIGR